MKIELEVSKIQLLLTYGQDEIILCLNMKSPYPEMQYDGTAIIRTRYDYGATWCKEVLGKEPDEVITGRQ